ncbi:hypothetical protein KEM60_02958 [Austwickia sp. TVS 96-490-7B]|nr:hypothetical protein [Austwickia sp. TVS 96-490-7B]
MLIWKWIYRVCGGVGCVGVDRVGRVVHNVYMTGEALGRPVSVRLPESLRVRVEALAAATRRSRGDVLREAMEREVDRLEWEQQLLARAVQVRTGQVRALSADEVDRMLGLDGVAVPADAVDDLS